MASAVGVELPGHLLGEGKHFRVMKGLAPEFVYARPVLRDGRRYGPGKTELGIHVGYRLALPLLRIAEHVHGEIAHLGDDLLHVLCPHSLSVKVEGAIGHRARKTAAGVHLDARLRHFPFLAQGLCHTAVVKLILEGEGLDEAVRAVPDGSGADVALFGEAWRPVRLPWPDGLPGAASATPLLLCTPGCPLRSFPRCQGRTWCIVRRAP